MSLDNYINNSIKDVNSHMDRLMYGKNKSINKMLDWVLSSKGKQLRPRFLLASAYNFDTEADVSEYAAVLELVHMATLVHDDIIDEAKTRRNKESVYKKFGLKSAVYLGDYMMFSMIYNFQSEYKEKAKVLMEGVDRLCYGELNQYEKLYDLSITKEEYLENIKGKTASLFEIATMSGAILCDREDYISSMSIVGRNYGMLFQICDDLLDLYSDNKIGKPMFQDFENGVYTLPVIIAKENNEYLKDLKELANDIKDTGMDSEDKNRLLTILDNAGSKAKVKELANSLYNEGVSIIDSMENKESKAFFTEKYNDLIKEIDKMCK